MKVVVETRGTGDTSWGEDLNWHVRRASAWMGRSIASMRVWDTLRALEAVRGLPGIDPGNLSVAARGEMAAVALYAALLDGRLKSVFLESPPATQNAAERERRQGSGDRDAQLFEVHGSAAGRRDAVSGGDRHCRRVPIDFQLGRGCLPSPRSSGQVDPRESVVGLDAVILVVLSGGICSQSASSLS